MIRYKKGNFRLTNLLRVRGSVFPQSLHLAFWCGAMSAAFKIMEMHKWYGADLFFANVLNNNSAYSSFSVLIGFLVIFRTQQAYSRFWDSCKYVKTMQAEFFVTGANLVAFCRHPDTNKQSESVEVLHFQHVLIRLLSLLHAVCLMQLHGKESTIHPEVIDPHGLDLESLIAIGNEECKVELLVQWVQCLTVDGIQTGVCTIPAPILSRIQWLGGLLQRLPGHGGSVSLPIHAVDRSLALGALHRDADGDLQLYDFAGVVVHLLLLSGVHSSVVEPHRLRIGGSVWHRPQRSRHGRNAGRDEQTLAAPDEALLGPVAGVVGACAARMEQCQRGGKRQVPSHCQTYYNSLVACLDPYEGNHDRVLDRESRIGEKNPRCGVRGLEEGHWAVVEFGELTATPFDDK